MEAALKVGIVVLALACVLGILLVVRPFVHGRASPVGWLIGAPFFLVFPAWVTASRLTGRGGHFSATGFWVAAFLIAAVGCATFSPGLAIVPVVLALLTLSASASFRRWKEQKILRGQPPEPES
jgi:hypothetical protein